MTADIPKPHPDPIPRRAAWLVEARWGVMVHYLDHGTPASATSVSTTTAEAWNRRVDGFDIDAFVEQIAATGAGYVIFTVGQNSGHFCSPNAAYDRLTGIVPSKCSRRDLILEVGKALHRAKIRLIAYVPNQAPAADAVAVEKLKWRWGKEAPWPHDGAPTGERLAEFQEYWEAIVREWSLRWGKLVDGWWVDGCYFADAMYRAPEAPNFTSFADALRAGNSEAIVAFNAGTNLPLSSITECEDYTAGELDKALPLFHKWLQLDPGGRVPGHAAMRPDGTPLPASAASGVQFHFLSFLGNWWGEGEPRLPDDLVAAYTRYVNGHGGVVTWDVPIEDDGKIPDAFLQQLGNLSPLNLSPRPETSRAETR